MVFVGDPPSWYTTVFICNVYIYLSSNDVQFQLKSIPIQFKFRPGLFNSVPIQFLPSIILAQFNSNSTLENIGSIQFQFPQLILAFNSIPIQFLPMILDLNSIPIPQTLKNAKIRFQFQFRNWNCTSLLPSTVWAWLVVLCPCWLYKG